MPGTNQYITFAAGNGANALPYSAYASHPLRNLGHQPGVALAEVVNASLRQVTVAAAGVAKFSVDFGSLDCFDDSSPTNFALALKSAIDQLIAANRIVLENEIASAVAASRVILEQESAAAIAASRVILEQESAAAIAASRVILEQEIADAQFWHAGDIKAALSDAAPTGWLRANGAVVSANTYPALFAAIGRTYGNGDGSTTFGLPDLRGEFIRGFDNSRGVDIGRALGSFQADAWKTHQHLFYADDQASAAGYERNLVRSTGNQNDNGGGGDYLTQADPSSLGGQETRPRNIAALYLIKT